ncbi:MAG: glutamate 5-kinase [Hyphomicrobiales bacterium]|nr:MAG: glutamate 5-kinase [Hyphomicrobiales bacterium]
MSHRFRNARRVVIKIGSALLNDTKNLRLNRTWLEALADDVEMCRARGQDVVIVSSGAIAMGRNALGLGTARLKLEESQAAAAVGQIALAHAYSRALQERGMETAQVLLTLDDTEDRRRYINARNTLTCLLKMGVVPVINENDTVATTEIRYGDNDRLAARVTGMVSADCLVLLSDVDGVYTSDPALGQGGKLIPEIRELTPEIWAMARDSGSSLSRGGMRTKLEAARMAQSTGAHMVITSGKILRPLKNLQEGGRCTWVPADEAPMAARKKWISGSLKPVGVLIVDAGAVRALQSGKSLLPAGISGVKGKFEKGDAVRVEDQTGLELGRGIVSYGHEEAARIIGRNSADIAQILGYDGRTEMIHRDDLVVSKGLSDG